MVGSGRIIGLALIAVGIILVIATGIWVFGASNASNGVQLNTGGAALTIGCALLVGAIVAVFGVWFLMQGRSETAQFAEVEKEKRILNIIATQGTVQIANLSLETNMPVDQVKAAIYDLVGKGLFTGYVDWKGGKLVSADAAVINQAVITGQCPNCGAPQVVGGKGVIRCEYCGTEFFIPKGAETPAAQPPPAAPPPAAPTTPGT
jgi:ribosomal protein L37AE/L43A